MNDLAVMLTERFQMIRLDQPQPAPVEERIRTTLPTDVELL
jgi:hypothetical protein